MNLTHFLAIAGLQKALTCVRGDILKTHADHIAFAVNYPNNLGQFDNTTGFAGQVAKKFWPELVNIRFKPGVPVSHTVKGKTYHALPVHSNEDGGWDLAPGLIHGGLNALPVPSEEVITCVLIGAGDAGRKWNVNIKNIEGMSKSYKTIVLYVKELQQYDALMRLGIASATIPDLNTSEGQVQFKQLAQRAELLIEN